MEYWNFNRDWNKFAKYSYIVFGVLLILLAIGFVIFHKLILSIIAGKTLIPKDAINIPLKDIDKAAINTIALYANIFVNVFFIQYIISVMRKKSISITDFLFTFFILLLQYLLLLPIYIYIISSTM